MKFSLLKNLSLIMTSFTLITATVLTGCGRNSTDVRNERTEGEVGIETALTDSEVTATDAAATLSAIDISATETEPEPTEGAAMTSEEIIEGESDNFTAAVPYLPSDTVSDFSVEYKTAIENMKTKAVLPDGSKMAVPIEELNDSEYIILDIDSDGRDELIIKYMDGGDAGSIEGIYEYDDDNLTCRCELSTYPGAEYYPDGMILAPWSPVNQGLNPNFQPFNIYKYNPTTDVYDYKGYIDSWDNHVNETDYEGNKFPVKHDENENGILYSIQYDDQYAHGYIHDDEEYKELYSRLFNGDKYRISWLGL